MSDIPYNDSFIASINGSNCQTESEALQEIGRALLFPKYYGQNLDALFDCITDLIWLKPNKVFLVINEFDFFLKKEKLDVKIRFVHLLEDVEMEWLESKERKREFILIFRPMGRRI